MTELFNVIGQHYFSRVEVELRKVFMQNTAGQAMYNSDFCLTCLGLSTVIYETEVGRKADLNFILASLFLRVAHFPNAQYDLGQTIDRFGPDIGNEATALLHDQRLGGLPSSDMSSALHDAETLTLLTREPNDLTRFVIRNTKQTQRGAVMNLARVIKGKRMHTQIGRSLLDEVRPKIIVSLEDTLNVHSN